MEPTKDNFAGCILGQALGDAYGRSVGSNPMINAALQVVSLEKGLEKYEGQYSDNTQLARELIQSYVSAGKFDPANYAKRMAAIFSEGRIVGGGSTTSDAVSNLLDGKTWEESGLSDADPEKESWEARMAERNKRRAGNGSAMRAAPIGLMFFDDPAGLVQAACDQSRITHADPRCQAGSVAIAAAVAYVITHEVVNKEEAIEWIADLVEPVDIGFAEHIRRLPYWLTTGNAFQEIPALGQTGDKALFFGISPFVVPSVIWSLFAAFACLEDYEAAIKLAIKPGGDVDTMAAMTGAIVGARVGAKKLPKAVKRVNDNNTWGYYRLVNLANRVYKHKRKKKTVLLGLGDKIKNVYQK